MEIINFKNWLYSLNISTKVCSDIICRLQKIEKILIYSTLETTLDAEFELDQCERILKIFSHENYYKKLKISPHTLSKKSLPSYKYSINKYIKYEKMT